MEKRLFTKNFTLLVLGQASSLFGNYILRLALSMYVLEVTGSAAVHSILKYIEENIKGPAYAFHNIYGERKWQDNVKQFNDRVLLVFYKY